MGEQEETQGQKIHPWVYYIGPASTVPPYISLYFAAFCKDCRQYYTEKIPIDSAESFGVMSPSGLPRVGCKGVSVGF